MPTGTVVLMTPDSTATGLVNAYDRLVAEWVVPDPQVVPTEILERTRAVTPASVVNAGVWDQVRALRSAPDAVARPEIHRLVQGAGLVDRQPAPVS